MIQSEPKENRNRFLTAALKIEGGINKAAFKGNRGSSQHNMEARKSLYFPYDLSDEATLNHTFVCQHIIIEQFYHSPLIKLNI